MFSQVTVSVRVFILLPSTGCSSRITTNSGKTPSSKKPRTRLSGLRRNLFLVTHDSCFYVWEGRVSIQECNFVWREEINRLTDWHDKYFLLGSQCLSMCLELKKSLHILCDGLFLFFRIRSCWLDQLLLAFSKIVLLTLKQQLIYLIEKNMYMYAYSVHVPSITFTIVSNSIISICALFIILPACSSLDALIRILLVWDHENNRLPQAHKLFRLLSAICVNIVLIQNIFDCK